MGARTRYCSAFFMKVAELGGAGNLAEPTPTNVRLEGVKVSRFL
jgi:hypothetical protein